MIDVGNKPVSFRLAIARGKIFLGTKAFEMVKAKTLPKGDALLLAEIAGIQGAKGAFQALPLCHPLGLEKIEIRHEFDDANFAIITYCIASTHAKTGIEMEVLAGVNNALLTIWDLSKMIEPNLRIGEIELLLKLGGKSGVFLNPNGVPDWLHDFIPKPKPVLQGRKLGVITMSDRAHNGVYEDVSGTNLIEIIKAHGGEICEYALIPDDGEIIKATINGILKNHNPHAIITTGGTGVAKRDFTPETIAPLFDREIPGIGEILRNDGAKFTPLSWSSRAIGGMIRDTIIVTLPGSPKAVKEGMGALLPSLLPHLIKTMRGE